VIFTVITSHSRVINFIVIDLPRYLTVFLDVTFPSKVNILATDWWLPLLDGGKLESSVHSGAGPIAASSHLLPGRF
jgi:hypothetical protein